MSASVAHVRAEPAQHECHMARETSPNGDDRFQPSEAPDRRCIFTLGYTPSDIALVVVATRQNFIIMTQKGGKGPPGHQYRRASNKF